MLKQDYIDAQKIINQAKNELESIFNKAVPESAEDQEAHHTLLQLIDQFKRIDSYYNHLHTTKIEAVSENEKLFANIIKRNKENLKHNLK